MITDDDPSNELTVILAKLLSILTEDYDQIHSQFTPKNIFFLWSILANQINDIYLRTLVSGKF